MDTDNFYDRQIKLTTQNVEITEQMRIAFNTGYMQLFNELIRKQKPIVAEICEISKMILANTLSNNHGYYKSTTVIVFEPDQYIVCIDNISRSRTNPDLKTHLEIGAVYKVVSMSKCSVCNADIVILACDDNDITYHYCGCGNTIPANSYYADRFAPCVLQIIYSNVSLYSALREIERPGNKQPMHVVR